MNNNLVNRLDRELETLIGSIKRRYFKLNMKVEKIHACEYSFLLKGAYMERGKSLIIQIQFNEKEYEILVSFHVPSALKIQLLDEFKESDEDSELGKYSLIGGESFRAAFFDENEFVYINVIMSRNYSYVLYDLACQVINNVLK